jgi:D-alanyl-D-alanine endopeptidase (penicillin-binding protein 7)
MYVNRKLFLLWIICLAMILVALAIRLSKDYTPIGRSDIFATPSPQKESDGLVPSQSFYEAEQALNQESKTGSSVLIATPSAPIITARAYLVGDVSTGKIYIEKNSTLILPVASMSKLITAIESMDKLKMDQRITISEEASSTPDTSNFRTGETFTVQELLYPLLLNSSNIAAEALASTTNRVKFLELMSSYAWEIGMPSTFFADPSGINPRNVSDAKDFFSLARYLYKSRPEILAITKTVRVATATTTDHGAHVFVSIHPFVVDQNFLGGKTGHTAEAKDTMLTILNINSYPIAIIVLSSNNRKNDTSLLVKEVRKILNGAK